MDNKINITSRELIKRNCKTAIALKDYTVMNKGEITKDGKLKFNVNEVDGKGWRLVHNNGKVLNIFNTGEKSRTSTIWGLIVADSEKEVRVLGKKANLDFKEVDEEMAKINSQFVSLEEKI